MKLTLRSSNWEVAPVGDYVALKNIQAPGTLVLGYAKGDPVDAIVVKNWALDDTQVAPAEDYVPPRPAEESANRAEWESYVVGQGTSQDDARAASLDELKGMYEAPPPEEAPAWQVNDEQSREAQMTDEAAGSSATPAGSVPVSRPSDSDPKATWISYVVGQGGDEGWANA